MSVRPADLLTGFFPGCVEGAATLTATRLLGSHVTNLPQDSVANASLVISIDKELLIEHAGKLARAKLELILAGLDAVLGR